MQYSGGTASLNSYGDSEWESSFTQILSRTKQNLNRINQRYSSTSTSLSLPSSSSLSKAWSSDATFPADRELSGATVPSSSFLSDNDRNFLSKGNPAQHVATNSSPLFLSNGRDNVPSTLNMQADQEQKLLERLSEKLLSQLGHGIGLAQGGSREEVETLRTKVRLLSESNESLEKEMRGLQSKLFACTGAIESLTAAQRERERERDREKESGRGTVSKLESWARQEEVWREQTEERLNGIAKQLQRSERDRKDERELRPDFVTRADLDGFRDRVAVLTQQAASAALSAWHDKFEASLRQVERQVALVRIGASEGSPGGFTSQEQVEAALKHVMPSELLLKGTVAHEVLQLEMKLEERLESRLRNLLSSELTSEERQLKQRTAIRETILGLGLGLGLSGGEQSGAALGGGFSEEELEKVRDAQRMKTSQSQRAAESEMQRLVVRLEALGDRLQSLELSQEADQRNQQVRLTHADRKMEEAITVAQNSLTQVQFRAARLEDQVRDSELALRTQAATLKEEMLDRLRDHISLWSEEKVGIDRRLLVNEKIAEDCLERMKLSTSVMDAYFLTNPEVKRFRKTADNVDSLTQEWKLLQKEVRECSVALTKHQASSCPRSEHLLLRDRVAKIESTTETCIPDLTDSVKKLLESTMTQHSRLDTLDVLTQHSSGVINRLEERQSRLTDSVGHLQGEATKLGRAAEDNGADINSLKDSAGQMLSRVLSLEGRSTLAGKVCSTENSARVAQLADLTQQTVQLKSELAQLSRTIDGVSKDAARAAKDADAALKHALSVPVPAPAPVPILVQPAPVYGSPDPKPATKQSFVGRDHDGGTAVMSIAASGASPQDDNRRGHDGRNDLSTVDVSEPDSDRKNAHFDSRQETKDSVSVASFSDEDEDEVSVSQIDSPVHQRNGDFSQVNVAHTNTQAVGRLSPPQTVYEKAVKNNGDSILDFENSFDESILSVDLETHHHNNNNNNPDPSKSVDMDVLQIPTLSEPASSPKSASDEDSDDASHHPNPNPNPNPLEVSTEELVLPTQTPAEVTRTLPSVQTKSSNGGSDSDSDSDSEIDNSMLSDWDDESSRSRVGNALSSSMSSNVMSIQATSNVSSFSALPHLDRQEQESRSHESAREAAEARSLDANDVGRDDPPVPIHSHGQKAIINDQTQTQHHSLQLEESTPSLPATEVKATPSDPPPVDEKHPPATIAEEAKSTSSSSSSSFAADPIVRSSLTLDTSSFSSSAALNTSVPSSRATSPGKSSSAATPSAPLSIKERLRLRQEAMKLQKAQNTAVAPLSASSSDHGSVAAASKTPQTDTQQDKDKGKEKGAAPKQGDEVMEFEEFDD